MKANWRIVVMIVVLGLAMLACETVMSQDDVETADAAPPVFIAEPTEETPELANEGTHQYRVVATEQGCPLSVSAEYQDRTIEFDGTQVSISNYGYEGVETYDLVSPHRYLRYNTVDNPIVVTFNMQGYTLEVFTAGDDINAVQPCGYFTFTLQN